MNAFDVDDELIQDMFERRASRGDPAGLARSIGERTARIPQSHRVSVQAPSSMRLLAAAAVLVVTAGLGLAIAGSQPMRPDRTIPLPSAPLVELHQTARFVRPFTYGVNVGSGLGPTTDRDDRFSITSRTEADWGVVVVAASEARVHPCPLENGGTSRVLIGETPAGMLADLRVVGGVAVNAIEPGTLDGRPSASTTVDARRNACEYADLHVSTESLGSVTMRFDVPSRLWVTEVDGLPIVIQVWATSPEGLDAALPEGAALVDSIRFTAAAVSVTPAPVASTSPSPVGTVELLRPFTYRHDSRGALPGMRRTPSRVTFMSESDGAGNCSPEGGDWGITISTTRGALMYGCRGLSGEPPLRERSAEFLAGLESAGVAIGRPVATTFDGRDALVARIDSASNRCDPLFFTIPDSDFGLGSSVDLDLPSRLALTEVDDITMVIQVWASSEAGLDTALPDADAFLRDLHFTEAETAP